MIYIISGNDLKNKNKYRDTLTKGREVFSVSYGNYSKELFFNYASNISLFGESPIVISENVFSQEEIFIKKEFELLRDSKTVFIFMEDKINAEDERMYSKYATVKKFDEKSTKAVPKVNIFNIADAFAKHDKVGAWVSYRQAIDVGTDPEPISGMLFWKIKSLMISGSRVFSRDELRKFSSKLVSLHHDSHNGKVDFTVGLEQFILSSLDKK